MEQYEQGGPPRVQSQNSQDFERMLDRLNKKVIEQDMLIENLQRDIRKLKEKLNRHADHLNRQQRG